jgi:hypothetical protein
MKKHMHQPDRAAKPNQVISINELVLIAEPRHSSHLTEHTSYPGKPKNIHTVHKQYVSGELGKGKYIGSDGKITAFVWLDEDSEQS